MNSQVRSNPAVKTAPLRYAGTPLKRRARLALR